MVAHRAQLRGLWEEIARIDADNRGRDFWDSKEVGLGMILRFIKPFIVATGGDLNAVLEPYDDAALLEQHGEDVLDLFIRLASEELWEQWILLLLKISACGRRGVAFHGLFPLCPEGIWSLQQNIVHLLFLVVIVGHNTEVLSTLLAIDGALPLPSRKGLHLVKGAVKGGSLEVMSTLLTVDSILSLVRGVDDTGASSRPLLSLAVRTGNRSMVRALIKAGAPLELYGFCRTPLATAVASDHTGALGIVRELLDAGADVNNGATRSHHASTPLCIAAATNKDELMDLLLAAGADLGKERAITLPLHAAAQHDCCGAMQRLISAGANVHQLDSRGRSALHMACLHNCEGAVKLLLRFNACMTLLCDEGLSPFDVVAIAVLIRRESNGLSLRDNQGHYRNWHIPSTLSTDETSIADSIHGLLRRASGWGRRGWLVLMRHRIAHDLRATESSSPSPPFVELGFGQTATTHDSETNEDANDGGCELRGDGDIDLERICPRGTAMSEEFEGRPGHAFTPEAPMVDNSTSDGGGKVRACDVLRGAVEWLVQCPNEVGVFRETLTFL